MSKISFFLINSLAFMGILLFVVVLMNLLHLEYFLFFDLSSQYSLLLALRVLQHIIISHHSVPEFGAAKIPSTPEAVFIALLDNLDAKTQMVLSAAKREDTLTEDARGDFTDKVWSLDTRVYWKDPLKV